MNAIALKSELKLTTQKAEQQLKRLTGVIKPFSVPVSFSTKEVEAKVAKLKAVSFAWDIKPVVQLQEVNLLQKQIESIRSRSQFTVTPLVDTSAIRALRTELSQLKQRATFEVDVLGNLDLNKSGASTGLKELQSAIESQKESLDAIAQEQRNTQQAIRQESAVSLGNLIKNQVAEAGIGGIKRAVIEEFNIDPQGFEKLIKRVLPSRQIIASDLKKFSQNLSDATGASDLWRNTVDDFLVAIADATAGTNNFEDVAKNLKAELGEVAKVFKEELAQVRKESDSIEKIQAILGFESKDQTIKTLADTNTVKSTIRSLVNATEKQVAQRKNRIQTERLEDVLDRARELVSESTKQVKLKSAQEISQLEPGKQEDAIIRNAKRVATRYGNVIEAIDDSLEELLIVIGGHTQTANNGVLAAKDLNQAFQELEIFDKKKAVGVKNPDTFTGSGENPASAAFAVARPNVRGFSRDAEEMAAQAIAALVKNPNLKVKLVGESGGGLRVEEAIQILNKLGFGNRVSGQGFGTPSFKGKASNPQNFTALLGINQQEPIGNFAKETLEGLGVLDGDFTRRNPKVAQSLKAIQEHDLDAYLETFEAQVFIFGEELAKQLEGRKQVRATTKSIERLQESIIEKISLGFVDYARQELQEFEDSIRITGKSKPLFDQLRRDFDDIELFVFDELLERTLSISKELKAFNKAIPRAEQQGATDFFAEVRGKIPALTLELQQLELNAPKLAKNLIADATAELKKLNQDLPKIDDPELLKANFFKKELDKTLNVISGLDPSDAIATITEIEPQLKEYLAAVRELDNNSSGKQRIQSALESQLKAIKTARKLSLLAVEFDFKELIKNPSEYLALLKDATLAKSKESVKQSSLRFANDVKNKAETAIDNFAEDFRDRLIETIEQIKRAALPGNAGTPLLGAGGGIVKAGESGIVQSKASEAARAVILRGLTDVVSTSRNTFEAVQNLEKFVFDLAPVLKPVKGGIQAAAPVIGGVALASQSPEIAQLAKLSSAELANVIEPLIATLRQATASGLGNAAGQIPGVGVGARGAIQLLLNNNALNPQIAQALAGVGTFGALGGGTGAIARAGGRLLAKKTFEKLPESIKDSLTPENIKAFDQLVGQRQQEIKALGSQLNRQIAQLKSGDGDVKDGSQKLLAGYKELGTEIAELEQAVSTNNKIASDRTRDRIKELKGIQKSIAKAISNLGDKGTQIAKNTIESIFEVKVEPFSDEDVTKKTLKTAIAEYKKEIIAVRKKIEKQILSGDATDVDLKAAEELAKRGQALSSSLKAQGGFSSDARALGNVSDTLAKKVAGLRNEAEEIGEEVINGVLQGSNQKLAKVFIQGRILGKELLDGFKKELRIKSPSEEFAEETEEVGAGISKSVDKQRSQIGNEGAKLGKSLTDGFARGAEKGIGRVESQLEKIRRTAKNALKAVIGFGAVQVSSNLSFFLEDLARQALETSIEFERLEKSISFSAGDGAFESVRDRAVALRTDITATANAYKGLAAAARGTELEQETDRIFNSVLNASKTFQLSADQTEGALLAVSQIISKGKVQAEELRGQLGERIPGAFQVAARAMSVTTDELDKLLSTGQVTANDFLPKFARQLSKETRDGVSGALNTTGSSLQNLRNEFTLFQVEAGKASQPAVTAFFNTTAAGIAVAKDNLNVLLPVTKLFTATIITLLLPAIVSLIGLVKTGAISAFQKLLPLTGANAVGLTALGKAARVASAGLKTLIILEGISQTIGLLIQLKNTNKEAADAVDDLTQSYAEFLKQLKKNREEDTPLIDAEIIKQNVEEAKKELNGLQKVLDFFIRTDQKLQNLTGFDKLNEKQGLKGLKTFEEAVIEDAEAKAIEAIALANANLSNLSIDIGLNIQEIETNNLQSAIELVEDNIANLNAQVPTTQEGLDAVSNAITRQEAQLKTYNDELERRNGLTLTVAKIVNEEMEATRQSTQAREQAIAELNRELLASGDVQKDISQDVLKENEKAIQSELESKRFAIAKIESLDDKQRKSAEDKLKEFQDRVIELESELVATKVEIAQREYDEKLADYEEFLEEVDARREKAETFAVAAQKERNLEIQQLLNDGVIAQEEADRLRLSNQSAVISQQLEAERRKYSKLRKFRSEDKELEAKNDAEKGASKQKILDLTISLLEQERQAEEKTLTAIANLRSDNLSQYESNINRVQSLFQQQSQLNRDRDNALVRGADLELANLQRALELRRKINSDDTNSQERKDAIRELNSLGIEGKTSEFALLNKIADREEELAEMKLRNLDKQQEREQKLLEIENQKLIIATRRASIEARQGLNEADKQLTAAENALDNAQTPEEVAQANEQFKLARESYELAQQEVDLIDIELAQLDSVISRKQEILDLNQAIADQELNSEINTQRANSERAFTQAEESDLRRKEQEGTLSNRDRRKLEREFSSVEEKVAKKLETAIAEATKRGVELSEVQTSKLEQKFLRQERNKTRDRGNFNLNTVSRRLTLNPGDFAPQSFKLPDISTTKFALPASVPNTDRNKSDNLILKTLQNIESKLKQPTVNNVRQENQFINQVTQDNAVDEVLDAVRSENLELMRDFERSLTGGV